MPRIVASSLFIGLIAGHLAAQSRVAFDAARQRVIMFGTGIHVWEAPTVWRGLSNSGTGGPPRMVSDPVGNRVIAIHGGGNTCVWSGAEWAAPVWLPPDFFTPYLVWDVARNRLVALAQSPPSTWEWDGTTVRGPIATPWVTGPTLGFFPSVIASDPATNRVLGFGWRIGGTQETWLWNGTTWTLAATGSGPSLQFRHLVGDPVRRRLVGQAGRETWEWDGVTWTLAATGGPNANDGVGLVFDPIRRMCLFVGWPGFGEGVLGWTGFAWVPISPRSAPPFRIDSSSAYDAARDRLVVFGGNGSTTARQVLQDTWMWLGTYWLPAAPATPPGARDGHVMEYHAPSQRVVLFGGRDVVGNVLGDTWLWDGNNWSAVAGAGPAARAAAAFAFESARGTCLLFGGSGAGIPPLADTWQWNGTGWRVMQPVQTPPARASAALAHDPGRGRTVLTGGRNGTTTWTDTWEWDGVSWLNRATSLPSPGTRALAFHPGRARIIATGAGPQAFEWDGTTWSTSSLPGDQAGKDFDSRRGHLVTPFVSGSAMWPRYLGAPPLSYSVVGGGCGSAAGAPGLTSTGYGALGDPYFRFEMTSRQPFAPVVLGVSLTSASQPLGGGCDWQLGPAVLGFQLTNGWAMARWPADIPVLPWLIGVEFHAQGMALDAAAPLGFGLTNHLRLVIGLTP